MMINICKHYDLSQDLTLANIEGASFHFLQIHGKSVYYVLVKKNKASCIQLFGAWGTETRTTRVKRPNLLFSDSENARMINTSRCFRFVNCN